MIEGGKEEESQTIITSLSVVSVNTLVESVHSISTFVDTHIQSS